MSIKAIITGDITNSTSLSNDQWNKVSNSLQVLFNSFHTRSNITGVNERYELFRGDSFQIISTKPENALRLSLLIRAKLISLNDTYKQLNSLETGIDARISIGIGKLDKFQQNVSTDMSKILIDSGRKLEESKNGERKLTITAPLISDRFEYYTFEVISLYVDNILEKWTSKQAEAIFEKLNNEKEEEIATKLKIYQSAVNQRLSAAQWNRLSEVIKIFEYVIQKSIKNGYFHKN